MAAKKKNENANQQEPVIEEAKDAEETVEENTEKNVEQPPEPAPEAESEVSEQERYMRLLAEYDNYRKRSSKERENIYTDVRIDTVTKFLPVYDNLARALSAETSDEAYKKGVEMTFNQLNEVLSKLGVTEIEAVGSTFDPSLHNAVMHIEDEDYGEGEIIEEFQKGFKIGDKIIRFSMVKVAN